MKSLFLICILSAPLFYSSLLFSEAAPKKELGICGKLMSVVFKISPSAEPEFTSAITLDEEFCDYGRYEENANYILSLYNVKNQLIYDKHIYINPVNLLETTDPKKPGKLEIKKVEMGPMSRIVKFPLAPALGQVKSYSVKMIAKNKTYAKKNIDWK